MTRRPIIGYATRSNVITKAGYGPRFANNESYARALADNGAAPIMIPSLVDDEVLESIYPLLDGLLLTGGPDVDPVRYGSERHPLTDEGDAAMEHAELFLASQALRDHLPILGICRGIQSLNVVAGGTLYQDVADEYGADLLHPTEEREKFHHEVEVRPGSLLARIVGSGSVPVNSLHHQAVRDVAPGFVVTACATDGLIEAIERPGVTFVLGVQWHPEELYRIESRWANLFRAFVDAAREGAATREQRARPLPLATV